MLRSADPVSGKMWAVLVVVLAVDGLIPFAICLWALVDIVLAIAEGAAWYRILLNPWWWGAWVADAVVSIMFFLSMLVLYMRGWFPQEFYRDRRQSNESALESS